MTGGRGVCDDGRGGLITRPQRPPDSRPIGACAKVLIPTTRPTPLSVAPTLTCVRGRCSRPPRLSLGLIVSYAFAASYCQD